MEKYITTKPIDLNLMLKESHHAEAGAIVLFSGEARINNEGKKVAFLQYESFIPFAEKLIAKIIEEACLKWDLKYVHCLHKVGKVEISEPAVCIITSSVHRKEAYLANQYIIHRIKHEVPIWKKEFLEDGSFIWGGNCNCSDPNKHITFEESIN